MMKSGVLSLVVTMIFVLSISFAEDRITIEDTCGTWINSDYNEKYGQTKEIHHSYGTSEWYDKEENLWITYTWFGIEEGTYGAVCYVSHS